MAQLTTEVIFDHITKKGKMKNEESQTKQIFDFLMGGSRLNGMQALTMFKTWRLPARVLECEKTYGIRIDREKVKTESGKWIAEYCIKPNPQI